MRPGAIQVFFCTEYNYRNRMRSKMESDFVPSELMRKTIKKWWVFIVLMVLGGLAGMLATRIHKPVYQSQAVITTAVDYAYAGRLEDYELDHILLTVGDIIDSTAVRQQVQGIMQAEIVGLNDVDLQKNLTAIRKGNDWILNARSADPAIAQKMAVAWSDNALAALLQMSENARADFHTQAAMLSVENCFSQLTVVENAPAGCSQAELDQIEAYLTIDADDPATLRESILLSNLSFAVTTEPELPASPVLFRQNLNVLAGVLIGLVCGLGWFLGVGKRN